MDRFGKSAVNKFDWPVLTFLADLLVCVLLWFDDEVLSQNAILTLAELLKGQDAGTRTPGAIFSDLCGLGAVRVEVASLVQCCSLSELWR